MSELRHLLEWSWSGLPCVGNRVSGDLVMVEAHEGLPSAVIVDVAGHGPRAHSVAQRVLSIRPLAGVADDLSQPMQRIHQALAGTGRLAAAMAVRVCRKNEALTLEYCGVGNISLTSCAGLPRAEGRPGMLGQVLPTLRVQTLAFAEGSCVAVYTDGVSSALRLSPELDGMEVQDVPPELLRRYGRMHDDATCLVIRNRGVYA
jgi:hypothetical protein